MFKRGGDFFLFLILQFFLLQTDDRTRSLCFTRTLSAFVLTARRYACRTGEGIPAPMSTGAEIKKNHTASRQNSPSCSNFLSFFGVFNLFWVRSSAPWMHARLVMVLA